MTWIVPNQQLDPRHAAMASHIQSSGRLLVWPNGLPGISNAGLTVYKCTGKPRNSDGLAISVALNDGRDRILLTGDASYRYIPLPSGQTYAGLVASHHGGKMRGSAIPAPDPSGLIAYSYGPGNTYSHALPDTLAKHRKAGWTSELHTANPLASRPANILLTSPRPSTVPHSLPCQGRCQLTIQQV
jgi:hypothetical protein